MSVGLTTSVCLSDALFLNWLRLSVHRITLLLYLWRLVRAWWKQKELYARILKDRMAFTMRSITALSLAFFHPSMNPQSKWYYWYCENGRKWGTQQNYYRAPQFKNHAGCLLYICGKCSEEMTVSIINPLEGR